MPWAVYIRALKGGSASREPGGTLKSIRPEVVEIIYSSYMRVNCTNRQSSRIPLQCEPVFEVAS
jgi:hypothetical protein